jgi:proteasome lid subunit RPN8/RPN11
MSESQTIQFAAIITITLPNGEGQTDFVVVLASTDLLVGKDGSMKPLGDCTLGELKRFANELEAEVWAEYETSTLFDLVVEGQASISVINADDPSMDAHPTELTLEHLIIFPLDDLEAAGEAVAEIEDPQPVKDEIAEVLEDIDEPTEFQDEEAVPEVTVDESAPVFEERDTEAPAAEEPAAKEPAVDGREVEEPAAEATPSEEVTKKFFRILGKRRPLKHSTWTAVDILVNESAFRAAQTHAVSTLEREVAGVLIGPHPEKQPDGRYVVHISDAIIAKYTRMQGASVTYTPESWRYVNDKLAEMYPDDEAVIVGWYHTHPGFGMFLSSMDRFIHQNFFTQIWHIAMVLDPLARQSGFFCWDRGLSKVDEYEFPWPVWASGSW